MVAVSTSADGPLYNPLSSAIEIASAFAEEDAQSDEVTPLHVLAARMYLEDVMTDILPPSVYPAHDSRAARAARPFTRAEFESAVAHRGVRVGKAAATDLWALCNEHGCALQAAGEHIRRPLARWG